MYIYNYTVQLRMVIIVVFTNDIDRQFLEYLYLPLTRLQLISSYTICQTVIIFSFNNLN